MSLWQEIVLVILLSIIAASVWEMNVRLGQLIERLDNLGDFLGRDR